MLINIFKVIFSFAFGVVMQDMFRNKWGAPVLAGAVMVLGALVDGKTSSYILAAICILITLIGSLLGEKIISKVKNIRESRESENNKKG